MSMGLARPGEKKLPRDEGVVCDGIRGQVGQVAIRCGPEGLVGSFVKDLFTHRPTVAVPPFWDVFLGEGDVGGHGAIEKLDRKPVQEETNCGW